MRKTARFYIFLFRNKKFCSGLQPQYLVNNDIIHVRFQSGTISVSFYYKYDLREILVRLRFHYIFGMRTI